MSHKFLGINIIYILIALISILATGGIVWKVTSYYLNNPNNVCSEKCIERFNEINDQELRRQTPTKSQEAACFSKLTPIAGNLSNAYTSRTGSDWDIYTNAQYKFSIQHPKDLLLVGEEKHNENYSWWYEVNFATKQEGAAQRFFAVEVSDRNHPENNGLTERKCEMDVKIGSKTGVLKSDYQSDSNDYSLNLNIYSKDYRYVVSTFIQKNASSDQKSAKEQSFIDSIATFKFTN